MTRRSLIDLTAKAYFTPLVMRDRKAFAAMGMKAGLRSPEEVAKDEDFWFGVQHEFSIDRNIINSIYTTAVFANRHWWSEV